MAARLSDDPGHRVVLLDAGWDHGAGPGGWPTALLDAADWTAESAWGYRDALTGDPLAVGRVVGGSSAINAGGFNWPQRRDLAGWPAGWSFDALLPRLQAIEADPDGPPPHGRVGPMPVVRPNQPLSPLFAAFATASGHSWVADINSPDCAPGLTRRARNAPGGVRWNAAFAFLDPVRGRPNLSILAGRTVKRLCLSGLQTTGAETVDGLIVAARRTVLAAGAYNTPAILLRSGIGPPEQLRTAGIPVVADRPGVGASLRDHPVLDLRWSVVPGAWCGDARWQILLRARSDAASREGFDIQIAPGGAVPAEQGWEAMVRVELMRPRGQGSVRLDPSDPFGSPLIDSGLLRDERDRAAMARGVALARRIARHAALRPFLAQARAATPVHTYHHPCGTCRMGDDAGSVVDRWGRVRGIVGLSVADASVLPSIPSVPPHALVLAVADALAATWRSDDSD